MAQIKGYSKHVWETQEPITAQKLNNIELALVDLVSNDTNINSEVTSISGQLESIDSKASIAKDDAETAVTTAEQAAQGVEQGKKAWTYVSGAMTINPQTQEVTKNLATRFSEIESDLSTKATTTQLAATNEEVSRVKKTANDVADEVEIARGTLNSGVQAGNLSAKIQDMDSLISTNKNGIQGITQNLSSYKGNFNDLGARLNAIDGNPTDTTVQETGRLGIIEKELSDAHSSESNNITYNSIDLRFKANEDQINQLDNDVVKKADVKNNFTSTDTDLPLSALRGKELRDIIGGAYNPYNEDETQRTTVTIAINKAEANAKNYTDSVLGKDQSSNNIFTDQSTVAMAIDDINDVIGTDETAGTIKGRITAIETEIEDTRVENGPQTLDARFDAVEGRATSLESDVHAIATELAMLDDQDAIKNTNTKIDNLEYDVQELANEISMSKDEDGRLAGTQTRIDTIDTDLSAVKTEINNAHRTGLVDSENQPITDTLDNRFDAIEVAISGAGGLDARLDAVEDIADMVTNSTSGLAATKAIADVNANDINGSNGLKARIQALETAPKSATVIINKERIVYNNGVPIVYTNNYEENGTNTPITPTGDVDYLFETQVGQEIKYFYWKYIDNQWEKISGDGGSGTGSSNAEDYATYAAFIMAKPELNKDYYVLQADGIRHHYRYLNIEESPIEIDDYTNNIKRYNVEKIVMNKKTYLRLFEYNYNDSNEIDENIVEVKSWEQSTNYVKDQLVLYQTYIYKCIPDNTNDEEWIPENWALASNIRILSTIELPEGGGEATATHRIYVKNLQDQAQRFSLQDATTGDGITLSYAYTCYAMEMDNPDYKAAIYELRTSDGTLIASSNTTVDYLTIEDYNNNVANLVFRHVERFCNTNEQTTFILTLTIPNEADIRPRTVSSYVTIVDLRLKSTFSDLNTYPIGNISIPYQFEGMNDQTPTFTVTLDGTVINAGITSTNIVIREAQLAGRPGVHSVSIVASQTIGGAPIYSNRLNYQLGIEGGTDIMLFSGLSLDTQYAKQYKTLQLPYYLYIPDGGAATVSYTAQQIFYNDENEIISTLPAEALNRPSESLSTGSHYYNFKIYEMVTDTEYYRITISCGNKTLVFNITATLAEEQINIKKDHLVFDFKPERFTNNVENETDRLWHYENGNTTYKMHIPDGAHFDWRTGGWITTKDDDNNDIPCFCVKAGSRVEFIQENNNITSPLTLFWNDMETLGGSNFKCTFKIDNVKTPNAPFLTSLDGQPNTIINYGKTILSEKQDLEDDDTLLYKYINTKYIYTETINNKGKVVKEAISDTVVNNEPFSTYVTQASREAAAVSARNKNKKKIKQYISNIYDIANQASNQTHRDYLLKVLSGKEDNDTIDYNTIKDEIISYLFDETNYDAIVLTNPETNKPINQKAQDVYNRLVTEEADPSTITYAYRQVEPVNFDALLNGFIVEGKDGKDGIIAMILFTFQSTIKADGGFVQTVSEQPISTNTFAKTETFRLQVTNAATETKEYEVEIYKIDGNYTEIKGIRDASNKETRAYGLELNALGSNIYLPSGVVSYAHSEGDVIEFEYNINPEITGRINSSIIIYEDGVPSAAKLYATKNDIFKQVNPGCLTIGSDDCDVYIYKMRLYDQALSNEDILSNFYADGLTVDEMTNRYDRNKTLSQATVITPQLIATECPDLRVIMIEAPNLTGGKTSFIKNSKIRCIYKNGRPEDNWVALNAYHAGQGTSSDNYGASGRNLDIIFGFDGNDTVIVPKPQKNNYTFDPNYKSIIIKGLDDDNTNDILTAEEYEAAGYNVYYNDTNKEPGTVSLTDESVPNNWFNIKVNIASSENTNNAFLQKRFDRYLPYTTPAKVRDPKIKNDMEFFNCVIFIKETGTPSEFTEDKNIDAAVRPWHFYGIGNIGDSKKTDKTRVNVEQDPYEYCIEITDNGLKLSGFYSGVFYISNDSATRDKNAAKYKLDELQLMIDTELAREQVNMDYVNTLRSYLPESAAFSKTIAHLCENAEYSLDSETGEYTININIGSMNAEEREVVDNTLYLVPVIGNNFTYYHRFIYYNNVWQKIGEPITFERTSYGVKYPISVAEWTCSINDYYATLYDLTSGKGWDKSFEFRYDITTKDGETVARNDLEEAMNSLHQTANKKSFADMYSWLVTSSNTQFNRELGQQFIKNSPLYWYLFTERYTMIDSRAKNTFYHYGKVYISQYEYDGNVVNDLNNITPAEYLANHPEIKATTKVTALQIAEAEINFKKIAANFVYTWRDTFTKDDAQAAINDGYRFELWDYDNDTALGINNNGQMVFSAGLEDIDKDISGWIYNEAESVMWRRIRENMYADLGALYVQLKGNGCFNAENLIQEFDRAQNQFPEELWRLDFVRKYYRPFVDAGETTYLNDMANGRKRYQRRQFERNMAIYINSKYQRNGSYNENDIISFRPQFTWTAGRDTQIIIKPYSTMYINFALGNYDNTDEVTINTTVSTRIERGHTYTINAADYIHDFNNIQCIIYNASRIMSLEGLGNFECKQFILGAAKKLSVLKLGSATYENRSMTDITNMGLSDGLPLLEELDLTNIVFANSPAVFSLENFPLLKRLDASGSNIRSFIFKDNGMLESIIFPSVLTSINFNNLYNLIDTYRDEELVRAVILTGATNLTSYNSINSYSNSYEIVTNMLNNAGINGITSLQLNDINWTIGNISDLSILEELQEKLGNQMYLKGTINVTGKWSTIEVQHYAGLPSSVWPDVQINATGEEVIKHKVTYRYNGYVGNNGEYIEPVNILELYVTHNARAEDIVDSHRLSSEPTRASTIITNFSFGLKQEDGISYLSASGWKEVGSNVPFSTLESPGFMPQIKEDTIIETYFEETKREYRVRWLMDEADRDRNEGAKQSIVMTTSEGIPYGGGENLVAPTIQDIHKANQTTSSINVDSNDVARYKIFKGWHQTPINITPDGTSNYFDIYADWITGEDTIDNIFADVNELTPIQLLVLSGMNKSQRTAINSKINIGKRFNINLGYNSEESGRDLLTGYSSPLRLDLSSATAIDTQVSPISSGNDAFTIMLDYSLNENYSTNSNFIASIIMGCYEETKTVIDGVERITSVAGFALYHNYSSSIGDSGVCVGSGDMFRENARSRLISPNNTSDLRNVVVLRHPKNSEILYVYSGLGTGSTLSSNITVQTLPYNRLGTNATIYLGALNEELDYQNNADSQYILAKSIIYQARYWDKDLGADESTRLASWPHELMTYIISGLAETATSSASPSIGITTLTASSHGRIVEQGSLSGWGNSIYENICNKRVFFSLPIQMQSILGRPKTKYREIQFTHNESQNYDYLAFKEQYSIISNGDYIYFPSVYNLVDDSTYSQEQQNAPYETAPFSWLDDASNLSIYQYGTYTDQNPWSTLTAENSSYLNIRFQTRDVKLSGRIFKDRESTMINNAYNIFTEIKRSGSVQSGDIFIGNNSAYMYITGVEMNALGLKVNNTGIFSIPAGNQGGGWIQAKDYWLRSLRTPEMAYGAYSNNGQTAYVTEQGVVIKQGSSSITPNSKGLYINYSMAI